MDFDVFSYDDKYFYYFFQLICDTSVMKLLFHVQTCRIIPRQNRPDEATTTDFCSQLLLNEHIYYGFESDLEVH